MLKPALPARAVLALILLLLVLGTAKFIRSASAADEVTVNGAYALADAKSPKLGYVYFTICAPGSTGEALISGSSPIAAATILAVPARHNVPPNPAPPILPLDSRLPLVLQPGGPHLVLKGLAHPLRPGQKIEVTLTFAKSSPVEITADVLRKTPGAGAPQLPKGVKID